MRKDRKERAESYPRPLTLWFQVVRKSKWWGTLKCSLQLKYSSYCFHSHPYTHITTYVFLNLTLQHMEKVLVLLWKNSAARNRTLVRSGLLSWHQYCSHPAGSLVICMPYLEVVIQDPGILYCSVFFVTKHCHVQNGLGAHAVNRNTPKHQCSHSLLLAKQSPAFWDKGRHTSTVLQS